jgi:hypothetical protein
MHATIHVSPRALLVAKYGLAAIGATALVLVGLAVISWSVWTLNI